jgi:hypothetical protein
MPLNTTGWMMKPSFVFTHCLIGLSGTAIEDLVVLEARGKTFPITGAYKWSIYIFQAWYRELLLKDEWNDDMKIFDLDWSQYDQFCHEYQRDKVVTMPAPTIPMPSLLDTKNQSYVMIPSECHMTLYDTVDWVDDPLPLRTC